MTAGAAHRDPILVAAAIVLNGRGQMLSVRKRGTEKFMQPGGKIDAGETPLDALRRELLEEVELDLPDGPDVVGQGVFSAPAAHEPGRTVTAHVFAFRHDGPVRISSEIEEFRWIDPRSAVDLPLAELTRDFLLPLAADLAGRLAKNSPANKMDAA